jgi:hypothetical protein
MRTSNLRGLLQQAIDRRGGVTFRQLQELVESEERREPRGLLLNRTTASQLIRGTYRGVPTQGTIRAVAWLAGVPEAEAFTAAGQAPPGPPFAEELPQGVDALSTKERRAVIEVLRTLLSSRKELVTYEANVSETLIKLLVEAEDVQRSAEFLEDDDDTADDEGFLARNASDLTIQTSALLTSIYHAALEAVSGDGAKLQQLRAVAAMDRRAYRERMRAMESHRAQEDLTARMIRAESEESQDREGGAVDSADTTLPNKNTGPQRDLSRFVAEQVDLAGVDGTRNEVKHQVGNGATDTK